MRGRTGLTPEALAALEMAFRATIYRVEVAVGARAETGIFDLRIGEKHAAFDAFLRRQKVACWTIVTACNPGAQRHDAVFNADAQYRLLARIRTEGWDCRPALNRAEQGDWPDEAGCLLLGIDMGAARRLAGDFGQLACVYGETGTAPRLLWVDGG